MRDHYDFGKMKGKRNPYIKYLKQPVTIRLDKDVVAYFKSMSAKTGIPYQDLINLYLRDCAEHGRELKMRWASPIPRAIVAGLDPVLTLSNSGIQLDVHNPRLQSTPS